MFAYIKDLEEKPTSFEDSYRQHTNITWDEYDDDIAYR